MFIIQGFFFTHLWCTICSILAKVFEKYERHEIGKLFDILRIPVYLFMIFEAHFYELNYLAAVVAKQGKAESSYGSEANSSYGTEDDAYRFLGGAAPAPSYVGENPGLIFKNSCPTNTLMLSEIQIWLELRIFYSYVITGILFLVINMFKKLAKKHKHQVEEEAIGDADFLERYSHQQEDFSLQTFELVTTLGMVIAKVTAINPDRFWIGKAEGSYVLPLVLIVVAGLISSMETITIWKLFSFSGERKIHIGCHLAKFVFAIAAVILVIMNNGKEIEFGYWVITAFWVIFAQTIYRILVACFCPRKEHEDNLENKVTTDAQADLKDTEFEGGQQHFEGGESDDAGEDVEPRGMQLDTERALREDESVKTPRARAGSESFSLNRSNKNNSSLNFKKNKTRRQADPRLSSDAFDGGKQVNDALAGARNDLAATPEEDNRIASEGKHGEHDGHGDHGVHLNEDFYAISFLSFKKDIEIEFKVSRKLQGRNFYACLWIFLVQMSLIGLIFKTVVLDQEKFLIYTPNVEVYIARFLASLLLHMELIEDVKQGLTMLHYMNNHPDQFSNTVIPFWIALMQSTGGFIAELTNLFMLSTRVSVEYCITFFVAFHVLVAVDNIYAESLSDFPLKEAVEHPLHFENKKIAFKDRSTGQKFVRVLYVVLNGLYNSVYYYFTPFAVNFVPYFVPGDLYSYYGGY